MDRLHGNTVHQADIQDFVDCIQTTNLSELSWRGDYCTWTNKQRVEDIIFSRIDRAFGNYEWMMKWGNITMEYGLPGIYDHAPMILPMEVDQLTIKYPFRFFNVWADHQEFEQMVEDIWIQISDPWAIRCIWKKLKALRPRLRQLNNNEFRAVTQKIKDARNELMAIQSNLQQTYNEVIQEQEKITLQNLKKWSMVEESILKQKAKAKWIQLGDANTKYFSVVMKERTHRKQIRELTTLDGRKINEPKEIKEQAI
ncbi:uncharacterized protein LOC107773375 [Nicotiana tabacum]|uniref:Uncharacterized protein LOC107773375 n=1 Tax=Nicotiana tabacum TaxID=4097 RepID=A0A1S3Y7N5_TOBAC|nr:PREDICTED: uncharacterized protein LOC107773375 [Nicotiana tabacum]